MSCARHPVALQNMLLLAENFTLKAPTASPKLSSRSKLWQDRRQNFGFDSLTSLLLSVLVTVWNGLPLFSSDVCN